MSQPYKFDTTSSSAKERQQSEMYSSGKSIGGDVDDLKGASNYEALFDSGYNSNVQSKTFLDESDIESMHCSTDAANDDFTQRASKIPPTDTSKEAHSKTSVQQWSDSGVCITDSGLSITEDDTFETSQLDSETNNKATLEPSDLPRRWLKEQNSEGDT